MTNLEIIIEQYPDEEFLSADGFDDAIIGVTCDKNTGVYKLVYSNLKCVEILMIRDGMSQEEAIEYFDFNVEGAYMGEKNPIWVEDMFWTV
jgi:hypothetical protein